MNASNTSSGSTSLTALVVYESMFGNTEQVARAVATGLSDSMDVELHEVQQLPPEDVERAALLVAGGPTHAFSMTRESTRAEAMKQGAVQGNEEVGLREWLESVPRGAHAPQFATFDTRVGKVRHLPGSAARSAAKAARRRGFHALTKPVSFYVADTAGPLLEGELERAQAWGRELGRELRAEPVTVAPTA